MKAFILVIAIITNSDSDVKLQVFNTYEACLSAQEHILHLNDLIKDKTRQQIYTHCIEQ